jgi:hypothetical protein
MLFTSRIPAGIGIYKVSPTGNLTDSNLLPITFTHQNNFTGADIGPEKDPRVSEIRGENGFHP